MAEAKWYVVHTYSGYENNVKANIEKTIENNKSLAEQILEGRVPMQDVVELKDGARKTVSKKMFPGYVLLNMEMNDDTWYVVRNTRGVTGFVGPLGRPLPLTDEEVKRMHLEKPATVVTDFAIGETVKIIDGSLEGFIGTIDALDVAQSKCKVTVSMFGRLTPVELELYQIERADIVTED